MYNNNYSNFPNSYNNLFNPYTVGMAGTNPYQPNSRQEITKVNGRDGANAFPLSANSSILLLDINNPVVYLKQADGGGFCSVTAYGITPIEQSQTSTDTTDLERRIARLEVLYESNNLNVDEAVKQSKSTQSNTKH